LIWGSGENWVLNGAMGFRVLVSGLNSACVFCFVDTNMRCRNTNNCMECCEMENLGSKMEILVSGWLTLSHPTIWLSLDES